MHVVTYDCSSSDMGIAPDPDGIGLDLAWIGCTNDYIFTGYYNGPWNVTGLYALSTQSLNIPAETGPGLCTSFGHLYVAWGDPSTGRLEITQFK